MKDYLLKTLSLDLKKSVPVNYQYIFSRTDTEIGKGPSKYVCCDFFDTDHYMVIPFYKPVSTVFPTNMENL